MFNKDVETFYKASIISLFAAIIIAGFSFMMGKENLFLLLNINLGTIGDFVFNYITYLADGVVWAIFIIVVFIKRKRYLILSITTLLISTIISQGIKRYVFPVALRPTAGIKDISKIHTIPNVLVHEVGSFPSGHTTQIFAMFLLLCIFFNNKKMLWLGFIVALLVAYSRVYQAQHFPIDVAGGIVAALISVWLSMLIHNKRVKSFTIL
ncbi:MAG: phosphatase PAP2 family protein [Bacteroidetes bacterium]|jgi:membrane-associated phospholipid phosphatase|nr:phosphatase PAP2 family protein [Bacteroidota bacterium]